MIKRAVRRAYAASCLRRPLQLRERSRESLFLTFDDGPHQEVTLELLWLLEQYNAKATFFVIGSHLSELPHIAEEIVRGGHALGNHSLHHRQFSELGCRDQILEAKNTQELIRGIAPEMPKLFRAPQGRWSLPLLYGLNRRGYRCVHWSLDSRDSIETDPLAITARMKNAKVVAGDIILFHDDAPPCVEVLKELMPF
jgi:peptidoglycan/xylan/chitin deacetylase (PgdA/CDA1 family)